MPNNAPKITAAERRTLASVYRFIVQCSQEKAADTGHTGGKDAKGSQHDRAKSILPRG